MFNVIRPAAAPASLARQTRYDGQDVYDSLKEAFHDKCYICETKSPQDVNVEHFVAHLNDLDKKFAWKNLYFVCSRCNNIKGDRYNNLLDCCDENDDVYRSLRLLPPYTPYAGSIVVEARGDNPKIESTVDLLRKVYNGKGTVNKAVSAEFLRVKIFESLNRLQEYVRRWYSNESLPAEKEDALERMRLLIKPDAPYSAFMRDVLFEDDKLRFLVEEIY
ncbi:HNH endonuclease [Pantoea dispersa]|uniref:HNH endonuclease n=1 Tax=Pantoea TaxID=53335 RepID=UPI0010A875A2|nr:MULTISPECIES: HNH endonuclease [Pantoea]THD38548.1 hypothetical protein ERD80_11400 [Pantoea sp. R102]